jgi:hypothetical protein
MLFSLVQSKKPIRQMILCTTVVTLLIVAVTGSWGLEIIDGRLKLILYEENGRFNVFADKKTDADSTFYFFYKNDPGTTQLQVSCDENIFIMGDAVDFAQSVERTTDGGKFVWISRVLDISEEFSFISGESSPLAEGIKIRIRIKNLSEDEHMIGVRYLFDTYLGERRDTHFITSSHASISKEYISSNNPADIYWISPFLENGNEDGLLAVTDAAFVTPPEKVVFANLKRLTYANSEFNYTEEHNFNLLPYSINDSAVGQFYAAQPLRKNESREIIILIGTSSSYRVVKKTANTNAPIPKATDSPSAPPPEPEINVVDIIIQLSAVLGGIAALLTIIRFFNHIRRKKMLKKSHHEEKK